MNDNPAPRIRSISLFTATCIVIANMVGVGVFTSLGYQVKPLPSGFTILLLWVIGGTAALCGAMAYGELAAALPRSGGEYHLLSAIYHPAAGFLAGWLSITVGFAAPVAAASIAFGDYFHSVSDAVDVRMSSLVMIAIVTLVHLYGTRVGGAFQNVVTSFKIALLVSLIFAGAFLAHPQPLRFAPQASDWSLILKPDFASSLVFVMYAYTGWNATAYIVSELKDPRRNMPLSVLFGTGVVLVLYLGINWVFLRTTPLAELSGSGHRVSFIAATHIFGQSGGRVIAGLICAGLISTVSAMTWIGPRVSATMGEDWRLLGFLARRTAGGVPAMAILVQSAIAVVLVLTESFQSILVYIQFSLSICSFFTVLGVFILRIRQPNLPRPTQAWGYPITPLLFLAVTLWMLWYTILTSPHESLFGLATIALGLVVYALCPKKSRAEFIVPKGAPSAPLSSSQP